MVEHNPYPRTGEPVSRPGDPIHTSERVHDTTVVSTSSNTGVIAGIVLAIVLAIAAYVYFSSNDARVADPAAEITTPAAPEAAAPEAAAPAVDAQPVPAPDAPAEIAPAAPDATAPAAPAPNN